MVRDANGIYLATGVDAVDGLRNGEQAPPDSVVIMAIPLMGKAASGLTGDETPVEALQNLYVFSNCSDEIRDYPFLADYPAAIVGVERRVLLTDTTPIAVDYAEEIVIFVIVTPDFTAVETDRPGDFECGDLFCEGVTKIQVTHAQAGYIFAGRALTRGSPDSTRF